MSTQTLTQQVHLVNIITIAEDRLQSNFKQILNRLKKHEQISTEQSQQMKKISGTLSQRINRHEQNTAHSIDNIHDRIEKCLEMIYELKNKSKEHTGLIAQCQVEIGRNKKEIVDVANIFDEKLGQTKNQADDLQERINKAQADIYKAYEEILKKEDSTQVLKICREVEGTKEKLDKNEKQCKLLQHKLEKIQIQNQKSERNQTKKQLELMKEIEDKIKKQIKTIQKSLPQTTAKFGVGGNPLENQNSSITSTPQYSNSPHKMDLSRKQTLVNQEMRLSFKMEEDEANSLSSKNNFQKSNISKFTQKIQKLQSKIKALETTMTNLATSQKKSNKPESEQIKQKINEIKPELIKIWAKCDTLDDRIAFNQRKVEEKTKIINNLLDNQRENSVGRVDQKLKAFQTEVYNIIKELRAKIQAKVNIQDYQKYTFALDDRLRQLSEIVFLKSDKLEVKKALLFLESKIKQIILVISEDEQNEKDALLTKKQLKCMSCDKDIEKVGKFASTINGRGNWDAMPFKEHSPEVLGKFGMTGFGSLSKKLKKLQSKQLPVLKSKKTAQSTLQPIINTIPQSQPECEKK